MRNVPLRGEYKSCSVLAAEEASVRRKPAFLSQVLSSLFLSHSCAYCQRLHPDRVSSPLCADCLQGIVPFVEECCKRCGLPLEGEENSATLCSYCVSTPPAFDLCRSAFSYEGVGAELIRLLKYHRGREYVPLLGNYLADCFQEHYGCFEYDMLLFVPTHPLKTFRRGYTQTYLLASFLAERLAIPLPLHILRKGWKVPSQTRLTREERLYNIRHAFLEGADIRHIKGKRLLLIDDVVTTGATIETVATLLRNHEPAIIHVLTLARTQLKAGKA